MIEHSNVATPCSCLNKDIKILWFRGGQEAMYKLHRQ